MVVKLFQLIIMFFSILGFMTMAICQTATPSPTPSEEETKLNEEIRILELQKKKVQLEADLVKAMPTPTASALSASPTFNKTDTLSMEVEMQSYKAMKKVTDNIACDIRKSRTDVTTIVLFKAEDYSAWRNFKLLSPTLNKQLEDMKTEYRAWLFNQSEVRVGGIPVRLLGETPVTQAVATVTQAKESVIAAQSALNNAAGLLVGGQNQPLNFVNNAKTQMDLAFQQINQTKVSIDSAKVSEDSSLVAAVNAATASANITIVQAKTSVEQAKIEIDNAASQGGLSPSVKSAIDLAQAAVSTSQASIETAEASLQNFAGGAGAPPLAFSVISSTLAAATNTVRSFADLLAMFRTEVTFSEKDVTIDPLALKASLNKSFAGTKNNECSQNSIVVYDPETFSPAVTPAGAGGGLFYSKIIDDIKELTELKRAADLKLALYTVVDADNKLLPTYEKQVADTSAALAVKRAEVAATKKEADKATGDKKADLTIALAKATAEEANLNNSLAEARNSLQTLRDRLEPYKDENSIVNRIRNSRLTQLNTELTALLGAFNKDFSGTSLLTSYVKAENLSRALEQTGVYWLQIKSVKAGGNTRVQRNFFRYFYKPDISHSGGSIIGFALSDKSGSVVLANTDAIYLKYEKANRIQVP